MASPSPAPLKETVVRRESTYVPVEAPNRQLAAHLQAMDLMAQKYPGSVDFIEKLKSAAEQIESGMPKQ